MPSINYSSTGLRSDRTLEPSALSKSWESEPMKPNVLYASVSGMARTLAMIGRSLAIWAVRGAIAMRSRVGSTS